MSMGVVQVIEQHGKKWVPLEAYESALSDLVAEIESRKEFQKAYSDLQVVHYDRLMEVKGAYMLKDAAEAKLAQALAAIEDAEKREAFLLNALKARQAGDIQK